MLRFAFLTNGAAIISILTFLGNLKVKTNVVPDMKWPLCMFLLGLISAGVAGMCAYFVQFTLYNEGLGIHQSTTQPPHMKIFKWTVFALVLSMLFFGVGAFIAVSSLH